MLESDSWQMPIHDVMKTNVVCYDVDTPVLAIYNFLCRVSIRRVLIVSDGVPCGVISRGSLLQWFSNWVKSRSAGQSAAP
jgi:CBS domain-containing protein